MACVKVCAVARGPHGEDVRVAGGVGDGVDGAGRVVPADRDDVEVARVLRLAELRAGRGHHRRLDLGGNLDERDWPRRRRLRGRVRGVGAGGARVAGPVARAGRVRRAAGVRVDASVGPGRRGLGDPAVVRAVLAAVVDRGRVAAVVPAAAGVHAEAAAVHAIGAGVAAREAVERREHAAPSERRRRERGAGPPEPRGPPRHEHLQRSTRDCLVPSHTGPHATTR